MYAALEATFNYSIVCQKQCALRGIVQQCRCMYEATYSSSTVCQKQCVQCVVDAEAACKCDPPREKGAFSINGHHPALGQSYVRTSSRSLNCGTHCNPHIRNIVFPVQLRARSSKCDTHCNPHIPSIVNSVRLRTYTICDTHCNPQNRKMVFNIARSPTPTMVTPRAALPRSGRGGITIRMRGDTDWWAAGERGKGGSPLRRRGGLCWTPSSLPRWRSC